MHVVLVTETYFPHTNGVVRMVRSTAEELRRRGHRATIIAPVHYQQPFTEPDLIPVPALPLPGAQGYSFALPKLSQAHHAIIAADIVHTHHPFVLGHWAQQLAHAYHKPFIFTHHTRYRDYAQHRIPLAGSLVDQPLSDYILSFIRRCSVVTAPSADIVEELRAAQTDRPFLHVPNGIKIERFRASAPGKLRDRLTRSGTTPIVLTAGRLAPEKNPSLLFQTILSLPSQPHLLVAGDGPARPELERMVDALSARSRVSFLGSVSHEDMPAVYQAADLLTTASTTDTHPLVLMEAAAAGLPVIAVDSPGTRNVVVDHQTGLLTRPTKSALGGAIQHLLDHPHLRYRYGQQAVRQAAEHFSIERSVDGLLDAYALARRLVPAVVHG